MGNPLNDTKSYWYDDDTGFLVRCSVWIFTVLLLTLSLETALLPKTYDEHFAYAEFTDPTEMVNANDIPEREVIEEDIPEEEPPQEPPYKAIDYGAFRYAGVWTSNVSVFDPEGNVVSMNKWRHTYYSSRRLYHYRTPEWTLCEDMVYRDSQNRVVVACDVVPEGTELWSEIFGHCIVLDNGVGRSDTIDVYVGF